MYNHYFEQLYSQVDELKLFLNSLKGMQQNITNSQITEYKSKMTHIFVNYNALQEKIIEKCKMNNKSLPTLLDKTHLELNLLYVLIKNDLPEIKLSILNDYIDLKLQNFNAIKENMKILSSEVDLLFPES